MTSEVIACLQDAAKVAPRPTNRPTAVTTTRTDPTFTSTDAPTAAGDRGVLLADALSVNAITSGLTGAALAVGGVWLATPLGAPTVALVGLGIGLVLFAEGIVAALAHPRHLRRAAWGVVAADVAWIVGAAAVVTSDELTARGDGLLVAVTVAVAVFATAQVVGLRRAGGAEPLGARPVTLTATREVAADPQDAWRLVADAAGYAAFAPGIARTETDGQLRDGMGRTCVDDRGRTWQEACTVHDPGRRYRMAVDTSTYPLGYRLLLHDFGMTWEVAPAAGGARLTLTFAGSVKLGVLGRLAMVAMGRGGPAEQILERYVTALEQTA